MITSQQQPVSGKDYPRTWSQFLNWFATEETCLAYLERLRWPAGFACPHCGTAAQPSRASRARLICRACRHQSSVTAGTIFDKTRTPLTVWFGAAWYVTNQKQGVSALGLQRVLGLTSYQTVWTMLHRLRRAMVRPGREQLKGNVEVDETYIAITERGKPKSRAGRKSHTTKTLVAVAVEIADRRSWINSTGNGALFATLQVILADEFVLAVLCLPRACLNAWSASRGLVGQALVAGNTSWRGAARPTRLLSG